MINLNLNEFTNGPDEFCAIDFARSDFGFNGTHGKFDVLLSPIGALNSQLALTALHGVCVLSSNGLEAAGKVNNYIVVMRCRRDSLTKFKFKEHYQTFLLQTIAVIEFAYMARNPMRLRNYRWDSH